MADMSNSENEPGGVRKAWASVKSWASGVREDAKAMPGLAKDIGRAVGQVPVMPPSGEASNSWRNPDTVQTLPNAQENKAAQPPTPVQPSK